MPDLPQTPDGDDFLILGADQFTSPQHLSGGKFIDSMNTINRGGIVQTRPGSRTLFTMPEGILQGSTLFVPTTGVPQIVFAVAGIVYASAYPFQTYSPIPNIKFNAASRFVAWASCLKSTDYDSSGTLYFLDNPYSVLIMQDGTTRAAYWDGTNSGHLDPSPSTVYDPNSGEVITQPGLDSTPVGLWMKWSNNRLWVSRGNQIFASDIGNPMKFVDAKYLNEGRAFYLPDDCTGIGETSDVQGIVCFTSNTGTFLQSSIQDRTQWLSTPGFQKTVLTNVGCTSHRSIVTQYGLVWWYSSKGMINQNDALSANITSKMDIQDNPMFATKENMSWDLSGIAGCNHENFVLMSVPYADKYNARTMVIDMAPVGEVGNQVQAWCGHWTGWRPVEWAKGVINGEERVFFASVDYDGKNRMWEAFTYPKTDNGLPITCWLMTREHVFRTPNPVTGQYEADGRDYKLFTYAQVDFRELMGDVSVQLSVAGAKGAYQVMGSKEVVSSVGQIYADEQYGPTTHIIAGSRPQTRTVKTQDSSETSDCNAGCVESEWNGLVDKGFSMLIAWSGIAGVESYRIFVTTWNQSFQGNCEVDEVAPRLLNPQGCGSLEKFLTSAPFTTYTSTASYAANDPDTNISINYTATQTSNLSQADADRKAQLAAKNYVLAQIGVLV